MARAATVPEALSELDAKQRTGQRDECGQQRGGGGEGGADTDDVAEHQGDEQGRAQCQCLLGEGVDDAYVLEKGDVGDHAGHEQDGGPGNAADEMSGVL
jgi:hypothetical protein